MAEPFRIKYQDIKSLVKLYRDNLGDFLDNAEECKQSVQSLIDDESFKGATADTIKAYLSEVVMTILQSAEIIAQTMLDYIGVYLIEYGSIDNSKKFNLIQEELQDFKKDLNKDSCDTNDISEDFKATVRSVEDLIDDPGAASRYALKCQSPMLEDNKRIRNELDKLMQDVTDHEKNTYKKIKSDIIPLITALNKNLENIKLNYSNVSLYKLGTFPTSPDLVNLVNLVNVAVNNHNVHQSEYEADWEKITYTLNADDRKSAGVWKTIGGISLAAGGIACVILTAGAATPVVAYLGLAAGTGSALFGTSDTIEGTADIYYGSIGDATTVAPNPLLYSPLFNGDRRFYNDTEFVFGLASSVFAPVGKANPVTFRGAAQVAGKTITSLGFGGATGELSATVANNFGADENEVQTARLIGGMIGGKLSSDVMEGQLFVKETKIVYSAKDINDHNLTESAKETYLKFCADSFKSSESFENSLSSETKKMTIEINCNSTCRLNENLNGGITISELSNGLSSAERTRLQDIRNSVPKITPNTVMQKVIPKDDVIKYLNGEYKGISGCCTRAVDAVSSVTDGKSAYKNLRLDYYGNKKVVGLQNNEDVFVMRFTSDTTPGNGDFPKLDEKNLPPCTGTGFTASNEHIIPEYMYKRSDISDAAIFKIDKFHNEKMIAVYDGFGFTDHIGK